MNHTIICNFFKKKKQSKANKHKFRQNNSDVIKLKHQNSNELYLKLKNFMAKYIDLEKNEWFEFSKYVYLTALNKKEFFIKPNDRYKKIGFIINGLLRSFFISEKGVEHTVNFYTDNDFMIYSKLLSDYHEKYFIEAVENTTILAINEDDFYFLMNNNIKWKIFLARITDKYYSHFIARIETLLAFSAEQRYLSFYNNFNYKIHKIPQYQIASYLGVTPVALNRIIKKLEKNLKN